LENEREEITMGLLPSLYRATKGAINGPIGPPPLDNLFFPVTWKCEYCGGDHTTDKIQCPGCGAPRSKQVKFKHANRN